ncbi:hypothetical protein B0H14DRAFT_3604137 [Mycena olivaceomarginata]|nr:hypothetical protein B0H14DRAFT_3604137 [Mycena olivaceomarginata]
MFVELGLHGFHPFKVVSNQIPESRPEIASTVLRSTLWCYVFFFCRTILRRLQDSSYNACVQHAEQDLGFCLGKDLVLTAWPPSSEFMGSVLAAWTSYAYEDGRPTLRPYARLMITGRQPRTYVARSYDTPPSLACSSAPTARKAQGEIAFCGVDTNKFTAPLVYSPLVDSSNWVLNSEGIFVTGQTASGLQNTSHLSLTRADSSDLKRNLQHDLPDIVASPDTTHFAPHTSPSSPVLIPPSTGTKSERGPRKCRQGRKGTKRKTEDVLVARRDEGRWGSERSEVWERGIKAEAEAEEEDEGGRALAEQKQRKAGEICDALSAGSVLRGVKDQRPQPWIQDAADSAPHARVLDAARVGGASAYSRRVSMSSGENGGGGRGDVQWVHSSGKPEASCHANPLARGEYKRRLSHSYSSGRVDHPDPEVRA